MNKLGHLYTDRNGLKMLSLYFFRLYVMLTNEPHIEVGTRY